MRRSVFAAALAAVAFFATACTENTGPAGAKRNRPIGVAHIPSFTTVTTTSGATLTTDQDDYAPGEQLHLSGTGWPAGDVISIHLDEAPQNHPPVDWTINVDASGGFTDATYTVQASDADVTFTITATSHTNGETATASFTDALPIGLGSLCANVAGFGDAICPTANGATAVLSPSHYKQTVGTTATYQIVGATDAFATGSCAPNIEVDVRNTNLSINSTICGTLVGSTITFSVTLASDKCGTAAVSYSTHITPSNTNNDIINDGVKNGNNTALGGIAPTDANGNVIIPIQGVCPTQPTQPNPPTTSCVGIVAVQGVAITPVTMVGAGGTGGPYTFSATGLPAGLTMDVNGKISGTPTVSGTFTYTVTVTDNTGHSGTFQCSVVVNPSLTANCVTINAVQNVAITPVTLVGSGGVGGPYKFTAIGLPTGLSMATDGTISGTPTVSGTFTYTVTVTDNAGNTGSFDCSLTVSVPPTANCVSITAVQGFPIAPVKMTGSGGTGGPYTFSATGLPSGLSMASDGTISGTPTVSGTFSYTVTVTDNTGHTGTINCSVTVNAPPATSCVSITAVQGVAITPVKVTGSGGTGGPYTFSATGLPAGVSMASDGTISGTPTASGTFSYTVTVTDNTGHSSTVGCAVVVNTPPTTSCVSITAVQGAAITPVKMTGSGGTGGPYTFTATGLPAGLSMASDGTISGTPTVGGTFNYTVTVTDNTGHTGTVNCSVTVNSPPTASCVTIVAVQGFAITPVKMTGSGGTGGPYTFSATGLPSGLSMASDGTISGTPTVTGTFSYTVTVTDNTGHTGTINCSLTVYAAPTASCIAITALQGVAMSPVKMTGSGGTGGPYTFSATGLPTGLSMASDGTISGTPTVTGTFSYTVTITDNTGHTGTINCSVTVYSPPTASCVSITAVQGVAIAPVKMTGSGGTGGPYTFSATGLPAGLSMAADGTISGTPTVNGTFSYTVTVTDAAGHKGTVNCSVTVNVAPTASCVAITAIQGVAITPVTLTGTGGTGGPYTFSATGLPAGLSISAGGTISGTPTVSGTFSYTVTVKDKNGNAGAFNCSVTVGPAPSASCVTITAWKGAAITPVTLTGTGGAGGPYTFSATGLPAGLTMSANGTISGTPTVTGTFSYTVTVTDKNGNKGTFNCSVTVNSDGTPPVCTVYESANPPYMSYQDGGSGIVRLDVTTNLNSNFNVTISPTPVGTTFSPAVPSQPYAMPTGTVIKFPSGVTGLIKVSATRINTSKSAQLTVKATDAAGHVVTCDPIETTLTKLKQDDGDQEFDDLPYDIHFVRIENGGLKSMDIIVNGTTFKVKRLDDTEVRTVDVSSAMKHNNKNTIILSPNGKKGETADVTIGPNP